MGQVIAVSVSATLTQALLVCNLRTRIVDAGFAEVRATQVINFYRPPYSVHANDRARRRSCTQTIAKIIASTEYHTLPPDLQQNAAAGWLGALHVVFCCQIVRLPLSLFRSCSDRCMCARGQVLAALMFLAALPGRTGDAEAKSRRPGTPTP